MEVRVIGGVVGEVTTFILSDTGSRRTGSERMSDGLWLGFPKAPFGP